MRYPMTKLFDLFRTEDVRWFVAIAPPCHSERRQHILLIFAHTQKPRLERDPNPTWRRQIKLPPFLQKYSEDGIDRSVDPCAE